MAQLPLLPCLAKIKPMNNALVLDKSDRGEIGSIDWSSIVNVQTRVELYEIELFYPKILKSNVTTLETFFDTNKNLPVTTQPLGDGREYVGYLIGEPEVETINAIRFNVTIRLLAWRGMMPGMIAHYRETGIVGATPVTKWTNEVSGGSTKDFDTVVGTGANMLKSTINGIDCLLFDGTVNLKTSHAVDISDDIIVFIVAQFTSTPSADMHLFDSLANATKRHAIYADDSDSDGFKLYQGFTGATELSFDNDVHVFVGEFKGDATSKLTASGIGSATQNSGSQGTFEIGTLGARYNDAARFVGSIGELCIYDNTNSLTATEINQGLVSLKRKWMTK